MVTGAIVYPHRADLRGKRFYLCAPCNAWVGCHPGTFAPLGRLANDELRKAKMRAHAAFDPLWREGCRAVAYSLLAEALELTPAQCHIGYFDAAPCDRVVAVVPAIRAKVREIGTTREGT